MLNEERLATRLLEMCIERAHSCETFSLMLHMNYTTSANYLLLGLCNCDSIVIPYDDKMYVTPTWVNKVPVKYFQGAESDSPAAYKDSPEAERDSPAAERDFPVAYVW